jgi:pycsar effector protein
MQVATTQQLAEILLAETREEIKKADAKAMRCLQAIGSGGLAVLVLLPDHPGSHDWRFWSGATGWALAMLFLGGAIAPRLHGGGPVETVTFFGHVARLGRPDRVRQCIEAAADDGLSRVVAQLWASSRIAMAKYQLIRIALLLTISAAILIAVSLA